MKSTTFLVLIPRDIENTENFSFVQVKLQDYFGSRMIKDIDTNSPAIELAYPLNEEDRKNVNEILEGTEMVVFEVCGDDCNSKYDNTIKLTIDVK